jgi:hypothetical protein
MNFYADPAFRLCIFGATPSARPAPTFEPLLGPEVLPEFWTFCFLASAASIFAFESSTKLPLDLSTSVS